MKLKFDLKTTESMGVFALGILRNPWASLQDPKSIVRSLVATALLLTTSACTDSNSGFTALEWSHKTGSVDTGDSPTRTDRDSTRKQTSKLPGGQPGSISLGGAFVLKDSSPVQAISSVKIIQSTEGSPSVPVKIRPENRIDFLEMPPNHESNVPAGTYIQIGCDNELVAFNPFVKGLKALKAQMDSTESLTLQAQTVLLCGSFSVHQPFISVVAQTVIFKDFSVLLPTPNGVGAFSVLGSEIKLIGKNQVLSQGLSAAGVIADAPSIYFYARQQVTGAGVLVLKSVGGKQLSLANQ